MRVLVCGGRKYGDREHVFSVLNAVRNYYGQICIVEGGATGADRLARDWAVATGTPLIEIPANWSFYGNAAGGMRNGWMIEFMKPEIILAFPGGSGTANMKRQGVAANIPVFDV